MKYYWFFSLCQNTFWWPKKSSFLFYCLNSFLFYLESTYSYFPGYLNQKYNFEEIWNFWQKPWVYPFGKIKSLSLFQKYSLIALKPLFLSRKSDKNAFKLFLPKNKIIFEEISNFLSKIMGWPFWKSFNFYPMSKRHLYSP